MNIIDLFAGAGGFSLGAHLAGFCVPLAIDLDKELTSSRAVNFPMSKTLHVDLANVRARDALKAADLKARDVVGVIGGPPCQGFSLIGPRDPEDPRNRLISHYFRFVREAHPAFFVLENVPGILTEPFRSILDNGIDSVGDRYLTVGPLCVDAASFGAPTRRRRVILIGYRKDVVATLTAADVEAAQHQTRRTVYEAIHDLPSPDQAFLDSAGQYCARYTRMPVEGSRGDFARLARAEAAEGLAAPEVREAFRCGITTGFKSTQHTTSVRKRFSELRQGDIDVVSRCPRLSWDGTCPTLRAGTGHDKGSFQSIRPIHPAEDRVITVREAARLQGFPDWFTFHPTQWHSFRMIGNSVSPLMAGAILSLLRQRIDD